VFLANFSLVRETFENPGLAADREHREAVLGYLSARSISALPFRRLAGADTVRASQLFQRLLGRPGFSWERDGEALLREHKPWCFENTPQPSVTPLGLNREVREGAGVQAGDEVDVTIELDSAPRDVEVPDALAAALASDPQAEAAFESMAFTHRKEYARWVADAKREETRQRRSRQALEMIRAGQTRS
jgi:Bacteriocin-protection, YdeI or OmpD-Associated